MMVIGIDVGLRTTGYVVCQVRSAQIELIDDGQIVTRSSQRLSERLHSIYAQLEKVIRSHSVEIMAIERLYSHYKHPATLGVLAQVRGIVVLLSHQYGLDLHEYSPTRARKAMLGAGNVRSAQVKRMGESMLKRKIRSQHIADALSLVIAFSHYYKAQKFTAR
ncbi:MAG: crossover junction endodeoxyribonuclease RuvC [Candidatus Omnitrophica bacterium]|nr:crossover junction endodeoxyribonuclease RuvC [Candidatus Omnitrophota bacterium]